MSAPAPVHGMEVGTFTATAEAEPLGLTPGQVVAATRWDGTAEDADRIVGWITGRGGTAFTSRGCLCVADGGDLSFGAPGCWVARTGRTQFTILGDTAFERVLAAGTVDV